MKDVACFFLGPSHVLKIHHEKSCLFLTCCFLLQLFSLKHGFSAYIMGNNSVQQKKEDFKGNH